MAFREDSDFRVLVVTTGEDSFRSMGFAGVDVCRGSVNDCLRAARDLAFAVELCLTAFAGLEIGMSLFSPLLVESLRFAEGTLVEEFLRLSKPLLFSEGEVLPVDTRPLEDTLLLAIEVLLLAGEILALPFVRDTLPFMGDIFPLAGEVLPLGYLLPDGEVLPLWYLLPEGEVLPLLLLPLDS